MWPALNEVRWHSIADGRQSQLPPNDCAVLDAHTLAKPGRAVVDVHSDTDAMMAMMKVFFPVGVGAERLVRPLNDLFPPPHELAT